MNIYGRLKRVTYQFFEVLGATGSGVWDDERFPATAINPPGQVSDPDYNHTDVGYDFADGSTEMLQIAGQLSHTYKEGSSLRPHIHWRAAQAGLPLWRLEYKIWNNGELEPDNFTSIDTDGNVFTWASGNLGQISTFPEIDGTGFKISANIVMKIYRIGGDAADTYNGAAALFREFDIHYQKDSGGSTLEYIKQTAVSVNDDGAL